MRPATRRNCSSPRTRCASAGPAAPRRTWPYGGVNGRPAIANTLALEILLRFGAADPAPPVQRFLAGWAPAGLDHSRLEDLRLWGAHGILWWAGLSLSQGADRDADLTSVYAAARHSLENDDPVSWLSANAACSNV